MALRTPMAQPPDKGSKTKSKPKILAANMRTYARSCARVRPRMHARWQRGLSELPVFRCRRLIAHGLWPMAYGLYRSSCSRLMAHGLWPMTYIALPVDSPEVEGEGAALLLELDDGVVVASEYLHS